MTISWIVALIFFLASIAFLVLWLRARSGPSGAGADATATLGRASDVFEVDRQYVLLGRGKTSGSGSAASFGAALNPAGDAFAFLISEDVSHLNAGDSFQLRNDQLYKVRQAAHVAASHDDDQTAVVSANQSAQEVSPAPNSDIDDGMTVMVSAAQTEAFWRSQVEEALPSLEVLEGVDAGSRFFLDFDVTTIGRSESNGVPLREDGSSRVHCEIEFVRPNFVIRDLQSTNGTLLNGAQIDVAVLSFGDTITISDTVMEFGCKGYSLSEQDSEAAIAAFEQCLDAEPDFLPAVKNLAFLLERDIRRKKDAQPLWDHVAKLEKLAGG